MPWRPTEWIPSRGLPLRIYAALGWLLGTAAAFLGDLTASGARGSARRVLLFQPVGPSGVETIVFWVTLLGIDLPIAVLVLAVTTTRLGLEATGVVVVRPLRTTRVRWSSLLTARFPPSERWGRLRYTHGPPRDRRIASFWLTREQLERILERTAENAPSSEPEVARPPSPLGGAGEPPAEAATPRAEEPSTGAGTPKAGA